MSKRPTWEEYFFKIATTTAERSTCPRLSVGAVIVKDNQIISTGYNGSVSGSQHCEDVGCFMVSGSCVRTVHAEQNAILTASKQGINLKDSVIYVTHEPCYNCIKYIIQSGIKTVYYKNPYDSEVTSELKQQILKDTGLEMIYIKGGDT